MSVVFDSMSEKIDWPARDVEIVSVFGAGGQQAGRKQVGG